MSKQRYYWMKLKTSFLTSNKVDFLMSQPEGSNYVMIYQMLVLKAINTGGKLAMQINGISVPYTIEKIKRDLKFFNIDTIRTAITLLLNLSLLKKDEDGCFYITDFENLVGSETKWAVWKRNQRQSTGQLVDNVQRDVQHLVDNVHFSLDNVQQDIDIDIDTEVDIDIYSNNDDDNKIINNYDSYALADLLVRSNFVRWNSPEYEQITLAIDKSRKTLEKDFLERLINEFNSFLRKKKPIITDKVAYFSAFLNNAKKYAAASPSQVDENAAKIIQAATKEWQERNT